jgi:hypothetical protein
VIQPKRSRLFLAASLNKPSNYEFEEELFSELKLRASSSVTELSWRPTFFPYLLTKAENPKSLLSHAFKLRNSGEVNDYRKWLRAAKTQWDKEGRLDPYEAGSEKNCRCHRQTDRWGCSCSKGGS